MFRFASVSQSHMISATFDEWFVRDINDVIYSKWHMTRSRPDTQRTNDTFVNILLSLAFSCTFQAFRHTGNVWATLPSWWNLHPIRPCHNVHETLEIDVSTTLAPSTHHMIVIFGTWQFSENKQDISSRSVWHRAFLITVSRWLSTVPISPSYST